MQKEQLSTSIENKTKIDTNTNNNNEQVYQALDKNTNSNLDKAEPPFFDATITENDNNPKLPTDNDTQQQIAEAKKRAEHEATMLVTLANEITSSKKRTFRRIVTLSVGSVVLLLILAIIFFIYLRWYAVGAGVAIIAFVVAQVWLHFFRKWNYGVRNEADFDENDSYNSSDSQDNSAQNLDELEKTKNNTSSISQRNKSTVITKENDDKVSVDNEHENN